MISRLGFFKLWFRVVWKLRSVYCSVAVHIFDILTDILVILSWLSYPDISNDNIDPRVMAISAIIVLVIHKLVSFIAFWAKEGSIVRCVLQVLDLLIFEEIYLTHKKILTEFKSRANKDQYDKPNGGAIETTSSFKYVRTLEAIFESIPQSVLQLVFIIRTGWKSEERGAVLVISILSIVQSIISMTNCILNNDNIYMTLPKWKKHKQRLPPTLPFIKHAICRLSEVIYRIGLCALFWVVCGGLPFSILIVVEFIYLVFIVCIFDFLDGEGLSSIDDYFLRVQMLIIMPSELVYAISDDASQCWQAGCTMLWWCGSNFCCAIAYCVCGACCCCIGPATLLSSTCLANQFYMHMSARIGLSMTEWIIIIIWPILIEDSRFEFLYSFGYGLHVFILSIVCFIIYSQYLHLFPHFELPFGIPIKSMYGYAFTGELEELQRLKPNGYTINWDDDDPQKSILPDITLEGNFMGTRDKAWAKKVLKSAFYGDLEELQKIRNNYSRASSYDLSHMDFSLDPDGYVDPRPTEYLWATPAILAISNKQYHVAQWLGNGKANRHQTLFTQQKTSRNENIGNYCLLAREHLNVSSRWSLPYQNSNHGTCLMLALSNEKYHVVEWLLKEKNVLCPSDWSGVDCEFARGKLDAGCKDDGGYDINRVEFMHGAGVVY